MDLLINRWDILSGDFRGLSVAALTRDQKLSRRSLVLGVSVRERAADERGGEGLGDPSAESVMLNDAGMMAEGDDDVDEEEEGEADGRGLVGRGSILRSMPMATRLMAS